VRKGAREECHARKALEHARGRTQAEGHRSAEGREEDSVSDTAFTDEDAHRPPDIHHRTPCRPGLLGHHGARGVSQPRRAPCPGQPRHPKAGHRPATIRQPPRRHGRPAAPQLSQPRTPVASPRPRARQETHTMTTLSPSRYEESPGFGPHKAGQSTGGRVGYHADSNSVFPTSSTRLPRVHQSRGE